MSGETVTTKEAEIEVLLDAIRDVQDTIRAFDLKAEILTGILTLLVGLVAFAWQDVNTSSQRILDVVVIIAAFGAMGCLMSVLLPMANPAEKVQRGSYKPAGVYFLTKEKLKTETVSEIAKKLPDIKWREELVYELMKVSYIRQRKHHWFTLAIIVSTVSFAALLLLCLFRYVSIL
ncbi:MAG: hypothetical protein ACRETO_03215 [Gammaproteobacteria bacterium]